MAIIVASGCHDDPLSSDARRSYTVAPRSGAEVSVTVDGITAQSLAGLGRAEGVNDGGVVVGDAAAIWTSAGGYLPITAPNDAHNGSSLTGINNQNQAVGSANTTTGYYVIGLYWSAATGAVDLNSPGRAYLQAINEGGDAVGMVFDLGTPFRAYYRSAGGVHRLLALLPGYGDNFAWDINDAGVIVGESSSNQTGRPLRWSSSTANPQDLGTLGGLVGAVFGINQSGEMVGFATTASGEPHAVFWSPAGVIEDVNTWPNGCAGSSHAQDISSDGTIVGDCNDKPAIWMRGNGMRLLPLPDGPPNTTGRAYGISPNGKYAVGEYNPYNPIGIYWELNPNRAPTAAVGGPYAGNEGASVSFDGTGSSDPDGDALSYAWSFGDGTTASGATPTHTYVDNGSYTVMLVVTDAKGAASQPVTTTALVANVAPSVDAIALPLSPTAVGAAISASTTFSDPGADTHSAVIDWGDATTSSLGSVTSNVAGSHSYTAPGVYTVRVIVTDDDGGSTTRTADNYVVSYDPNGGFVTGGGWIWSPAGAYEADPLAEGKASFGFVSRYQKGATMPTGSTEFQFHAVGLDFHSDSYQWLVVAGTRAQYKGTGTIKGQAGSFGFIITATDDSGTDRLRVKIFSSAGEIVYDNQIGSADTAAPTTALGGGSISIKRN